MGILHNYKIAWDQQIHTRFYDLDILSGSVVSEAQTASCAFSVPLQCTLNDAWLVQKLKKTTHNMLCVTPVCIRRVG